jgi:Lanthionine synthetase C-like protein
MKECLYENSSGLIEAWTAALSPELDNRRLAQRLRFLGCSAHEAQSGLSRDSLFGPVKEPAALHLLERGLALFERSNSTKRSRSRQSSGKALPFGEVLAPSASAAASDLIRRERRRWLKLISRPARRALVRSLLERLCETAAPALTAATSGPTFAAGHLCCGRCGRIDLLLEAASRLADHTLRDAAVSQAMRIESQAQESGFYALNGADRGRLFAPSLFQGTSGIGYTFLRIVNPQLPSVLSLG